jgi:hypothetical protein
MTKTEERLDRLWTEFVDTYEGSGFSYQFVKQCRWVDPVDKVLRLIVPLRPLAEPATYFKVKDEFEKWLRTKHKWRIKVYFHVQVWNEEKQTIEIFESMLKNSSSQQIH